jgi:hypothetical protein
MGLFCFIKTSASENEPGVGRDATVSGSRFLHDDERVQ